MGDPFDSVFKVATVFQPPPPSHPIPKKTANKASKSKRRRTRRKKPKLSSVRRLVCVCVRERELRTTVSYPADAMQASSSVMPHHMMQQHHHHQQQQQLSASDEERSLQAWREMVQASVECELCNEPYGDEQDHIPRLLSCGHTFCQVRVCCYVRGHSDNLFPKDRLDIYVWGIVIGLNLFHTELLGRLGECRVECCAEQQQHWGRRRSDGLSHVPSYYDL